MAISMDALLKIKAAVSGESSIQGLAKSLGNLNKQADTIGGAFKKLSGASGGLVGGLSGLASIATGAGLVAMAKGAIDAADNMRDLSIRTGVSVEQLSRLKIAAEMSGATIDDVGKALTKTAAAIGNSSGIAAKVTSAGTAQLRLSIADQMQLLEQRDQRQIANIKASADQQVRAVQNGEQRQVDAIERAKDQRMATLERESDQRLREINRRYRQEEKVLNDSFDDRRDAERRQAEEEQSRLERRIERAYEAKRKEIEANRSLSVEARDAALQDLRDQQDAELKQLRDGFDAKQKTRDRYYRDEQEKAQQAINDRRQKEEDAERQAIAQQKQLIEQRAKAEKDAVAKAAADRIAIIKQAASAQVKAIEQGNQRAQDAYAKLGIALRKADGSQRGAGEVFMDVFDAMQKLPTAAERAAVAFDLYGGKLATKLIPMFAMTRQEVEKLMPTMSTDFANSADSFNDSLTQMSASMERLNVVLAKTILPFAELAAKLPEPVLQLGFAFVALASGIGMIAQAAPAVIAFMTWFSGLNLAGLIAGWAPVIVGFAAKLAGIGLIAAEGIIAGFGVLLTWVTGTLIPGLLAVFSGPLGWTVLAIAAVVAMCIAFREPIMQFLQWLPGALMNGLKGLGGWLAGVWAGFTSAFYKYVTVPISNAWNAMIQALPNAMKSAGIFMMSMWVGIVNNVKGMVRGMLIFIANCVNPVGNMINNLIRGFNNLSAKVRGPILPFVPTYSVPAFATGGVVNGPTMALVGEAGQEYIIPAGKMDEASRRYLSGARGSDVIPSGSSSRPTAAGSPAINITTGPVLEFDGQRYVTMADFERGMRITAEGVIGRLRTPAARIALGMA